MVNNVSEFQLDACMQAVGTFGSGQVRRQPIRAALPPNVAAVRAHNNNRNNNNKKHGAAVQSLCPRTAGAAPSRS
jgi:hypothetical protein